MAKQMYAENKQMSEYKNMLADGQTPEVSRKTPEENSEDRKKRSVLSTIVTNLITFFFILTFLAMIYLVYCNITNDAPSIFGYRIFRVLTGSMEPTYPENSYILVKKADPNKLKVGDAISFYSNDEEIKGQINTHRIIDIDEKDGKKTFTTKGDANAIADSDKVNEEDIVGKVIVHISVMDAIGKAIRNPWVYLVLVIIPLATRFVMEIKNVAVAVLEFEKDKEDNKKDT